MASSLSFPRFLRVVTHIIPKECGKSRGFMIICWNNYIINSKLCQWSIRFANMKQKPCGFYEAAALPPWSEAHIFIFHVAKQRFIAEGCFMSCYATRLMHRRCASLQPKRRPMSGKVICGECGGTYGRLLWHSTTYRNCVWECFEKI